MPYSGSIVGRICVPGGGGDEVSSLALSESFRCRLERKVLTDADAPRCRSGSPARRLTVLGVLPISYFVGRSGQSRDSGSVIGFAIKVPTDRPHR